MSKKTLYILIAVAVILVGGIAVAVASLYSDSKGKAPAVDAGQFIERHELIEAVPSDAAIVFCVKNFGRAMELLGDTTAVFRQLTSRKFDKIAHESFEGLKKIPRSYPSTTARICLRYWWSNPARRSRIPLGTIAPNSGQ